MARLIDADAFLESIEGIDWYTIHFDGSVTQGSPSEEVAWYKAMDIYAATENAPTVYAVPVVHGRWITEKCNHVRWRLKNPEKWVIHKCSVCGYSNGRKSSNYCPNCGAKMDGDGNG